MDKSTPNYALQSIIAAYGLAHAPNYYTTLRMMVATGGKWSFSMPRTNMEAMKSKVPKSVWNSCYRAQCAHMNAMEGFPFFAAAMIAGTFAGLPREDLNRSAAQYLGLRVLYTGLYIGIENNVLAFARSGTWLLAMAVPAIMLWKAGERVTSLAASKKKIASLLAKNLSVIGHDPILKALIYQICFRKYSETYQAPNLLSIGIQKNKELGRKGTVVIACSDPRFHPTQFLDLDFSEAAIIRNPGGRTSDAIRSLIDIDAIDRREGFERRTRENHPAIAASQPGYVYGAVDDPEKTVVQDVEFLKSFPSIEENMLVVGLVLDTFTEILRQLV
ncbi:hypothetical protein VTL71DRAFT_8952 [Oculimacula yallundae]|uniref:Uncharacterized protein n=1 Tax=Oculimacula yallundae TaxID=86028 RepID=A0ABR4BTH4_9HELO